MKKPLTALLALVISAAVLATPAPWYRWSSMRSGGDVCSQNSPGEGWVKSGGPFQDARCEKRGRPAG